MLFESLAESFSLGCTEIKKYQNFELRYHKTERRKKLKIYSFLVNNENTR